MIHPSVGKTRLAIQAAQAAAEDYPDGICFVSLNQINSDELLTSALADALNFVPYGQESMQVQLHNYLRERRVLLILDSFEHSFSGWISKVEATQVLEDLLAAAPDVKALVTSRQRLRLANEYPLLLFEFRQSASGAPEK